jgi:putative transcriptional regulator
MMPGNRFMVLRNNIRKLRFERGEMTQAELAKAVGVSRQTIISIEKNRYAPSVMLALKIAKFFNVPLEKCFYLDNGPSQ